MSPKVLLKVSALVAGVSLFAGCRSSKSYESTPERTQVNVPFVNVGVGENGGVRVDAPFTNVRTKRYLEQNPTPGQPLYDQTRPGAVPTPPVSTVPTYQTTSQYQRSYPSQTIAPNSSRRVERSSYTGDGGASVIPSARPIGQ